jgi:hypothetical protein
MINMNKIVQLFDNILIDEPYFKNLSAIISSCLSYYQVKIHGCKIQKEINLHGKDNDSLVAYSEM